MNIEQNSALPICKNCRAHGAKPLHRTKRRNEAVNAKRTHRDRLIADVSQANAHVVSPMEATDIPPTTTSISPRTTKRGRRADFERSGKRSRRRLTRGVCGLRTIYSNSY